MEKLFTLIHYDAAERGYHIQKIRSSIVDNQMHCHKHYQIGFVLSGKLEHRQNRKYRTLMPGDAFIVPPGYPHSLHFLEEDTLIYSLCFDEHLFPPETVSGGMQQFLQGLNNETYWRRVLLLIRPDPRQQAGLTALMELLCEEQNVRHFPELSAAPGAIHAILCLLAQAYYTMPFTEGLQDDISGYNGNIRRCIRYVDTHFTQKLSVESLSRRFGISRSVLCSAFLRHVGMPLHKYIIYKRISEAQRQMRAKPGLSISQIAQDLGYGDDSTFYRNFLQITGTTPSQYRALCQKELTEQILSEL